MTRAAHEQHNRQPLGFARGHCTDLGTRFAVDDEEHAVGLRFVVALVFNELREPMAAISVSVSETRIPPLNIPRLGELLRQKAAGITAKLGGSSPAARGRF
jgi:DNA-binding IclR family transcriptional regulator